VSHQELEASKAKGVRLHIQVVRLATIDDDVTPELARETIESITVLGALHVTRAPDDRGPSALSSGTWLKASWAPPGPASPPEPGALVGPMARKAMDRYRNLCVIALNACPAKPAVGVTLCSKSA
jgi:Ribbon-Helix-Helix transcriptional regulator family